jgi:hypothetical protein
MHMEKISRSSGTATAQFKVVRARAVLRWTEVEQLRLDRAIGQGLDLDQTWKLFPNRTRDSVKDRYYRSREPQDRDEPAALCDARRQKDARNGSAKLLQALRDAGFIVNEDVYSKPVAK